jgi:hypothetical protein
MRRFPWSLVALAVCATVWFASSGAHAGEGDSRQQQQSESKSAAVQGRRVPCTAVMSKVHRQTRLSRGRGADISAIAKQLGTNVPWVERCMLSFGARAQRPGHETAEAREERLESFEEDEFEESGSEDTSEPGAREREEHLEKEREARIRARPTPELSEEYKQGYER